MTDEIVEEKKAPTMVEDAHNAAERLKAENARMELNIKKLEELKAFEQLGGKSQGQAQAEKPVEVSPADYAKMVLSGKLPIKK